VIIAVVFTPSPITARMEERMIVLTNAAVTTLGTSDIIATTTIAMLEWWMAQSVAPSAAVMSAIAVTPSTITARMQEASVFLKGATVTEVTIVTALATTTTTTTVVTCTRISTIIGVTCEAAAGP